MKKIYILATATLFFFFLMIVFLLTMHSREGNIAMHLSNTSSVKTTKIIVIVDNIADKGLRKAWGLSIYLEVDGHRLLFDTGPSPGVLEYNAKRLGIDLSKVEAVVISHEHGDHTGGLSALYPYSGNITVYIPSGSYRGFAESLKKMGFRVIVVNGTLEVFPGVYVVGPLYGPPWEEALAVNVRGKGLVVLTGCSHPGVDELVERAVEDLGVEPYIVMGGFHLGGASLDEIRSRMERIISMGVSKIYPLHCSGSAVRKYLEEKHPEIYGDGHSGIVLEIGG